VVIDHHASNDAIGVADWIEPHAAATCEMVTLLAVCLGIPLASEPSLAAALMAGIVMDTATFAHPNATPRTLAVSAALVEAGAPLSDISRRLYRSKPAEQLRLFGRVLDRLESYDAGRVVASTLLDADLEATGTTPPLSEGIIDLLAQADIAEVAQSDSTRRSYTASGSGFVRNRSTPSMNAYSGGTGSVQTGSAVPPNRSTSRTTPSVAPMVSASGFSCETARTRRAPRSRSTTTSGTTAR
jgi:nanoRNase/pAp phosphatase (c-di-AMP/oligoRNAs hydrolase)